MPQNLKTVLVFIINKLKTKEMFRGKLRKFFTKVKNFLSVAFSGVIDEKDFDYMEHELIAL